LFNDVLVYGQQIPKKDKFLFHRLLQLRTARIEDVFDAPLFKFINHEKSFTIEAVSEEEKNDWVTCLEETINELKNALGEDELSPVKEAAIWENDHEAFDCMICHEKFTLTKRRHHCRHCGRVICSDCSKNKHFFSGVQARICDECFSELRQTQIVDINSISPLRDATSPVLRISRSSENLLNLTSPEEANVSSHKEAAVWIPDNETKHCMSCEAQFTVIRRKHHCRSCGKVVCGACSSKRLLLEYINPDSLVRVCKDCYFTHFNNQDK